MAVPGGGPRGGSPELHGGRLLGASTGRRVLGDCLLGAWHTPSYREQGGQSSRPVPPQLVWPSAPETNVGARRARPGRSPGVSSRQVRALPCSLLTLRQLSAFTCLPTAHRSRPSQTEPKLIHHWTAQPPPLSGVLLLFAAFLFRGREWLARGF